MSARNRGAAQVSVLWFVLTLVVLFMALAGIAVQTTQQSDRERERDQAVAAAAKAERDRDELLQKLVKLAEVAGFNDPDRAGSDPTPEAVAASLENLKNTFPTITTDVKTLQASIPRVVEAFGQRGQRISTLESQARNLESELKSARDALTAVTRQKDEELQESRRGLAAANANTAAVQARLDSEVQSVRQQNRDLDQQVRDAKAASEKRESELKREMATQQGRILELGKKLAPLAKEPDRPDGSVVSVSESTPYAYVDLGAKDRLRRGMRFKVFDRGRGGEKGFKAWAQVVEVDRDVAEVALSDLADPFNPVVPGDAIAHPLYDPTASKRAVLLGRFSGRWNKRELSMLLSDLGVKVEDRIDLATDFLILGSEEEAAVVEQAKPLAETEEYKKAESFGVQIVPLKEIEGFFAAH